MLTDGLLLAVYCPDMPTEAIFRPKKNGAAARRDNGRGETERFEQRLGEILEHATGVFYEKGYDAASMRDLSRATSMSLAGLYYYFESKEDALLGNPEEKAQELF